jgi:hypothetical protein
MTQQTHLWSEEAVEADGSITVSITIEYPNEQPRARLWYKVPAEFSSLLTDSCDPFVVAMILPAMFYAAPLVVHGKVSPSLLQNLEEFQAAWACWRPNFYRKIEITAEVEQEAPKSSSNIAMPTAVREATIAAFSGGVDSCFTAFRHHTSPRRRFQRNLQAGLMVHGFDIPLEDQQAFDGAAEKSRAILSSLGIKFIAIATNYRQVEQKLNWVDAYGPAVASSLILFQNAYVSGLIASAFSYHNLLLPRGSNPVTDPFLSSNAFQIIHDGAGYTRLEKIREIANWQEARQNLRVCWQGAEKDRNCGQCEKCIRTILGYRVLGFGLPACFEQDVTDRQIAEIQGLTEIQRYDLELILEAAKGSVSDSWVTALETCIARNRHEGVKPDKWTTLKQSLPPSVRKHLRSLRSRLFSK